MNRKLAFAGVLGVMLLASLTGFGAGVIVDRQYLPQGENPNIALIRQAAGTIQSEYVRADGIKPNQLTYSAIAAMVESLGDVGHSRFVSPELLKQERATEGGYYEGIGAEVQFKDGRVVIVAPFPGSPAEEAGLHPGDIIVQVNGEDMAGLDLSEVVQKVKGPPGSKVTLTILDPAKDATRTVTLPRRQITISSVTWQQVPGTQIAHVHIAVFSQGTTDGLKKALGAIQSAGLRGIILDLRNDPGGLETEAISVASQFLKDGDVLLAKDAHGKITHLAVEPGGLATEMPLVVLINEGTASASEVVAGAIQDARRAQLVGATTFGTGTVLDQFNLSDGSALILATEEWLTPAGRTIWHKGLAPDVEVSQDPSLPFLLPDALKGLDLSQIKSSGDRQFLAALDIIGKAIAG